MWAQNICKFRFSCFNRIIILCSDQNILYDTWSSLSSSIRILSSTEAFIDRENVPLILIKLSFPEVELHKMDTRKTASASSLANFVWTVCFTVEAFFAVSGNLVTIIIFQKKQFRRRPNFLLISLAVADLLVGLLSIPLNIAANYVQNGSPCFLALVRGADMLPGFASIFTLTVIALERMYAIDWSFRHRVLKIQSYAIAIGSFVDIGVCCDLMRKSLAFGKHIFCSTFIDISDRYRCCYLHGLPCSLEESRVSNSAP